MTEDEAKTKWCPASRFVPATDSHHAFDNRGDVFDPMRVGGLCIGSACMAWRVSDVTRVDRIGQVPFSVTSTVGHCGLAGAPQ